MASNLHPGFPTVKPTPQLSPTRGPTADLELAACEECGRYFDPWDDMLDTQALETPDGWEFVCPECSVSDEETP